MIYVMSDLHGQYQKYREMLELIHFNAEDTLYVLGDVIDRGEQGIQILLDMMERPNVIALIGNHEWMAAQCLPWLQTEISEESINRLTQEQLDALTLWLHNGASPTITQFQRLSVSQREALCEYLMEELLPYEILAIDQRRFLLVHAGLGNFDIHKQLEDYTIEELVWERPDFSKRYSNDAHFTIIVGHTPTLLVNGRAQIYHGEQMIDIDCGAVYPGGRLSCLCLDTMQEYYI